MAHSLSLHKARAAWERAREHPARPFWPLFAAFLAMYVPTYGRLASGPWETAQDGHGPFILFAALWLAYSQLREFHFRPLSPRPLSGGAILFAGLLAYVIGRSQNMLFVEAGSQIPVLMGLILVFHGERLLLRLWFVLVFMVFLVPLPGWFMSALTGPLKQTVSALAVDWLYALGYPVSQNGVIIFIGQYKLLVKDACAGLNSMFSLSAVGLFYIYLAHRRNPVHSLILALFILPASFFANLVRVLILILATWHLGEAAGQGIIHDSSGVIMFVAALATFLLLDAVILPIRSAGGALFRTRKEVTP
ncbi:MAG: exosortase B [Alphaproteobacteria bacterium]